MTVFNQIVQSSFRVIRAQRLAPKPCLISAKHTLYGVVRKIARQE